VTTTAGQIRAGRYTELGAVIQRDASLVVERWAKRAAEEQPSASRVHHKDLLDHFPSFLQELATGLAESGDPHAVPHYRPAVQHGEQRWLVGWSLAEVVRDYRILRLVLLEHLEQTLARPLRLRESQAVGLALDEAVEASVVRYVHARDEAARALEESLREQAEALREADRRKNEFLATLAHELRNPLAPLRNCLEAFRLAGGSDAAFRESREIMDRQVSQMTRLVEDLLDVARIAQGKLGLRVGRFDLRQAVEQAVQMNAPIREARRHVLAASQPAEPLWVEGEQARIVQVIVNLLNNAAKYTPDGGCLAVSACREGGEAVVRVKDDGVGIPPERLAHVFDMFAQIDLGQERAQGGLGIGLTLVRRLVELHGGAITASSPGVGGGSEFTVRLPVAAPPQGAPADAPGRVKATPRHVVIVEDNDDGRESLAALLRLLGHRVDVAEDGPRGLEAVLSLRPEVALVDLDLPHLNGFEVARGVRQGLGGGVLLIALTGHSQPEDREQALKAGFDAHLAKPVDLEELQRLLATPIIPGASPSPS